jgi:hypothetical protein
LADQWTQEKDDYWKISRNQFANKECYQDPYRRLTFGNSPDKLAEANAHINSAINEAAKQASVFFFTFGVTEIFRLKSNGRVVGQKPAYYGGGGVSETELYLSTFSENFENLEKLREIVKLINPTASMVVTVSPVPLERTFSGQDVVVANCEGKSTLRAVLGEFSRMYNDVIYFPAYEMVTTLGEIAYIPGDLRHVKKSVVDMIVQTFANAHVNTTNNRE